MTAGSGTATASVAARIRCGARTVPGSRIAAVQLQIAVGSAVEGPGQHGLLHAVEHMVVRSALRPLRGAVTAETTKETTTYRVLVTAERARWAIDTLGLVLEPLRVDAADLRSEKTTIAQERHARENDLAWRLQQQLLTKWLHGTGYSHPTLGEPGVVDALTPGDIEAAHTHWYSTARAALVLAGPAAACGQLRARIPLAANVSPPAFAVQVDHDGPVFRSPLMAALTDGRTGARAAGLATCDTPSVVRAPGAARLAHRALLRVTGLSCTPDRLAGQRVWWSIMVNEDSPRRAAERLTDALMATMTALSQQSTAGPLMSRICVPLLRERDDVVAMAASLLAAPGEASVGRDLRPPTADDVLAVVADWHRQWSGQVN